ncbi:MAG: hypothetical protein AAB553_08110 [Patescibacteria group bacterium]
MKHISVQRGQALVTLLFFVVIAMTIISAGVTMMIVNSVSGMKYQEGTVAYGVARSGVENAILRLLRDPSYTGETMTVGEGQAVVQVSGNGYPYTITSRGTVGDYTKRIQVTAQYDTDGALQIVSEQEIF